MTNEPQSKSPIGLPSDAKKIPVIEHLGKRVRMLRILRDMEPEHLAGLADVPLKNLMAFEQGTVKRLQRNNAGNDHGQRLLAIAQILNTTLDFLFSDEPLPAASDKPFTRRIARPFQQLLTELIAKRSGFMSGKLRMRGKPVVMTDQQLTSEIFKIVQEHGEVPTMENTEVFVRVGKTPHRQLLLFALKAWADSPKP